MGDLAWGLGLACLGGVGSGSVGSAGWTWDGMDGALGWFGLGVLPRNLLYYPLLTTTTPTRCIGAAGLSVAIKTCELYLGVCDAWCVVLGVCAGRLMLALVLLSQYHAVFSF